MINASDTTARRQQAPARPCPSMCVRHDVMDEGTPDEVLIHVAAPRYSEGMCIEVRQTEFLDGERERPFFYVNGEEMSEEALLRFAGGLLAAALDAKR